MIRRRKLQRSGQSMVEMAMIAPILILVLMATIDFGRAAYDYATLAGAVRDGARVAILTGANRTNDTQVWSTVKQYGIGLTLNPGSCVNGQNTSPLTPAPTAPNTGYIYIVSGPSGSSSPPNAPGGQAAAPVTGSCAAVVPAYAIHAPLTVEVVYDFQPITPLAAQFLPSGIVMTVSSTMSSEY